MALEQVSSIVKSMYLNSVSGYDIQYNISQEEGKNVQSITAIIKKSNTRLGYITVNSDRTMSVFFEKPLSEEDSVSLFSATVKDANSIFEQRNKTE